MTMMQKWSHGNFLCVMIWCMQYVKERAWGVLVSAWASGCRSERSLELTLSCKTCDIGVAPGGSGVEMLVVAFIRKVMPAVCETPKVYLCVCVRLVRLTRQPRRLFDPQEEFEKREGVERIDSKGKQAVHSSK